MEASMHSTVTKEISTYQVEIKWPRTNRQCELLKFHVFESGVSEKSVKLRARAGIGTGSARSLQEFGIHFRADAVRFHASIWGVPDKIDIDKLGISTGTRKSRTSSLEDDSLRNSRGHTQNIDVPDAASL